jgi:hypothetical protein
MEKEIRILVVLSIMFIFGCSQSPKESVVGKWKGPNEENVITELYQDGTFTSKGTVKDTAVDRRGSWRIEEDGKITADYFTQSNTISRSAEFKVDGDTLTTVDSNGNTKKYSRQ